MGAEDLLNEMSSNSDVKKKSTIPTFVIEDEGILNAMVNWDEGKSEETHGKAKRTNAQATMAPVFRDLIKKYSIKTSSENISIKVAGTKESHGIVTYVLKTIYKKIEMKSKEALASIFGDMFDKCFKVNRVIKIKSKSANNMEFLNKLVEILGEDEFKKHFEVESTISTNAYLASNRFINPQISDMHEAAMGEGLIEHIDQFSKS